MAESSAEIESPDALPKPVDAWDGLGSYNLDHPLFQSCDRIVAAQGNPELELAARMAGIHRGARVAMEVSSGDQIDWLDKPLVKLAINYLAGSSTQLNETYQGHMKIIAGNSATIGLDALRRHREQAGSSSIADYLTRELAQVSSGYNYWVPWKNKIRTSR